MRRNTAGLASFLVPAVVSLLLGSVLVFSLAGCQASGPKYPSKQITYWLPFAQGSSSDMEARSLMDAIAPIWPEAKFEIKNESAGGGTACAAEIFKAKPDGYTFGMIQIMPLTMQPWLMGDKIPYKGPDDFTIVNQIFARTTSLVVKPDSKYNTVKDVIDDFKSGKRTEPFTYAGRGVGNAEHLTMEMLRIAAGLPEGVFKVVPYANDAEGVAAVMGGHIEASNFMWASHKPMVEAGQLKVLWAAMPFPGMEQWNIKSSKDFGYDIQFSPRHYTIMPKGTPADIVAVVEAKFKQAVTDKKFLDYLDKVGDFPLYTGPADTVAYVKSQYDLQGKMAKDLGLIK